jgi:probable H4MPT-linked C1 transfer pathway protein
MVELFTGFDIGGAHLKAAQVTQDGRVVAALQVPCALWRGLDRLEQAFEEALSRLAPVERAAITMTGELADLFPDRATGVRRLAEATQAALPRARHRLWAGRLGFVAPDRVASSAVEIASANWLASATLAARLLEQGLFVDLGSTTTDILVLARSEVRAEGLTDRARLATGELVYTGLTRTALMALADRAPFAGRWVGVMKEHFATTADIYRVLELLPEEVDQHEAADGGPKTAEASVRRLARMIGADSEEGGPDDWRRLAGWFARRQMRVIEDAAALQLSRGLLRDSAPLIGAGCGRFLLRPLAHELGLPYRDFTELLDLAPEARGWAASCAPAVAVAVLAAREPERAG